MTWAAFTAWWSNNAVVRWITYIVLFLIGWEAVKRHLKQAGRDAERAAIAKKQAEVRVAVNERSTQIINEEREHADQAIRARDSSPDYPSSDLVPDPIAGVIFRD